jgi:hypothetical protein
MPVLAGLYKGAAIETATKIGDHDLAASLSYISSNADTGDNFYIVLTADESAANSTLSYSGKTVGITLMSGRKERTISPTTNGNFFTVSSGVTLTLEQGVVLQGRSANTGSLIKIDGGTFVMNGGKISGNTLNSASGGGVYVNSGTFTMNVGEISSNKGSSGGGVYVNSGTFTMNGGEISGNDGGGVYSKVSFTMNGGKISGNTSGIYIASGTFNMIGGEISDNFGSGVTVASGGYFTMDDGGISRNNNSGVVVSGTFVMNGGQISNNLSTAANSRGGGVYNAGTFTMNGGEIISNFASNGGGVYSFGGIFHKNATGGVIYGSNASPLSLANHAANGIAVGNGSGLKIDTTVQATDTL